jgi:flagellar protein FlbD
MIEVERLDGTRYWINPHQRETITVNPDVTQQMLLGRAEVVKTLASRDAK